MRPEDFSEKAAGRLTKTIGGHLAFIPHPLPPHLQWDSRLANALSSADRALGELAGLGRVIPNPYPFIRLFVHREAVLSSRIEGTRASISEVYAYEAVQLRLWDNMDVKDVREVVNYVRALEHGMNRLKELPVSLRLLRELHSVLMQGVLAERALRVSSGVSRIGSVHRVVRSVRRRMCRPH